MPVNKFGLKTIMFTQGFEHKNYVHKTNKQIDMKIKTNGTVLLFFKLVKYKY